MIAAIRSTALIVSLAVTLVSPGGARAEDRPAAGLPSTNAADYDVAAARAAVEAAQATVTQLQAATPVDTAAVATAQVQVTALQARLDEVSRNLDRGKLFARAQGGRAGAVHGTSAGVKRGVDEARAQAAEQGVREARAEFEAGIGREVESAAVRSALTAVLRAKATELRGTVPAELAGRVSSAASDGAAAIVTDGANAFAREIHERNATATRAAADAEGVATGTARARTEAVTRSAEGSRAPIQARYFDPAALESKVLENRAEIRSRVFEDTAAPAAFDYRTMANYRPDRAFPHAEITFAFREAYDSSFLAAAAPAYESSRAEALPRLLAAQRYWELERLRRLPRGADLTRRERELHDGFMVTYRTALDAAYAETLARLDRELHDRVKTEADGRAYAANLEPFTREEIDARVAAEGVRLSTEFHPRATGVALVDADEDSVFAPGEGASVVVSIQNFGEVSQSEDVKVLIRPVSDGLVADIAEDALVPIPGRSQSVVRRAAPFFVKADAAVASTQRLAVQVMKGSVKLLEQEVSLRVGYPFEVTRITGPRSMAVGESAAVTVRVRNASTRAKAAPIRVSFAAGPGAFAADPAEGTEIDEDFAPGATKEVTLGLVPRAAGAFEGFQVRAQVRMDDWLLGEGGSRLSPATWRHRYEADTTALVVVGTDEEGQLARRMIFRGAYTKYRILDLRIDSLSEDVIRPYRTNHVPIVLLSTPGSPKGPILRSSLIQGALGSGAQVLFVSPGDVARVAGTVPARFRAGTAFEGLIQVRQAPYFFRDSERRIRSVPFTSQPGTFAVAASEGGLRAVGDRLASFIQLATPFETKLRNLLRDGAAGTSTGVTIWSAAILHDLRKELADNEGLAMRNYEHRPEITRLNHLVATASAATGSDRCRLAALHAAVKAMVDERVGFMDQVFWPFSRERTLSNLIEPLGRVARESACTRSRR